MAPFFRRTITSARLFAAGDKFAFSPSCSSGVAGMLLVGYRYVQNFFACPHKKAVPSSQHLFITAYTVFLVWQIGFRSQGTFRFTGTFTHLGFSERTLQISRA